MLMFFLITVKIVPALQRAYVFKPVLDAGGGKFVLPSNFFNYFNRYASNLPFLCKIYFSTLFENEVAILT